MSLCAYMFRASHWPVVLHNRIAEAVPGAKLHSFQEWSNISFQPHSCSALMFLSNTLKLLHYSVLYWNYFSFQADFASFSDVRRLAREVSARWIWCWTFVHWCSYAHSLIPSAKQMILIVTMCWLVEVETLHDLDASLSDSIRVFVCMHMYLYVYIYIHLCIYIFMDLDISIYVYIYEYIHI